MEYLKLLAPNNLNARHAQYNSSTPKATTQTKRPSLHSLYQLAFLTPTSFPSRAFIRNWNCLGAALALWSLPSCLTSTYPCHPKRPENTSAPSAHGTAVLYLGGPCVAMHLTELQLRLCSCPLRQRCVADDVAERLPGGCTVSLGYGGVEIRLTSPARTLGTPFSWCDRG
jgi:hypothetical protein